jgi:hypothetical protein
MRRSGVRFISPAPIQAGNSDGAHLPVIADVIFDDSRFSALKSLPCGGFFFVWSIGIFNQAPAVGNMDAYDSRHEHTRFRYG